VNMNRIEAFMGQFICMINNVFLVVVLSKSTLQFGRFFFSFNVYKTLLNSHLFVLISYCHYFGYVSVYF